MLKMELAGQSFVKAEMRRELIEGPLAGRTEASIDARMRNVSSVIEEMGLPRVAGYVPASNVGRRVAMMIEQALSVEASDLIEAFGPSADTRTLEDRAEVLMRTAVERPIAGGGPERTQVISIDFVRDPRVVAWVRAEAGGMCELCGREAPFSRNGLPFLEVHHVVPLGEGGTDAVENAVAVCPNCHRRAHLSDDSEAITEALYQDVDRLTRE
jgi:5-methylcytosine-specific restriction protein A